MLNNEILHRDIKEPLCGWQWVYAHLHDLDGWTPKIEITRPGSRYSITSKDTNTLNRAIKEITG